MHTVYNPIKHFAVMVLLHSNKRLLAWREKSAVH